MTAKETDQHAAVTQIIQHYTTAHKTYQKMTAKETGQHTAVTQVIQHYTMACITN